MVQEQFHSLLSAERPSGNTTLANCSATDLADERYSCTNYVYAPMLENIISSITAATRENAFQTKPSPANTLVSEAKIQFAFDNTTSDEKSLIFVPNRQALSSLSAHVINNDDELFANTACTEYVQLANSVR